MSSTDNPPPSDAVLIITRLRYLVIREMACDGHDAAQVIATALSEVATLIAEGDTVPCLLCNTAVTDPDAVGAFAIKIGPKGLIVATLCEACGEASDGEAVLIDDVNRMIADKSRRRRLRADTPTQGTA